MIFDEQLEQNILGSIMHLNGYGEAVENAVDALTANDFYFQNNKQIFAAIKDLSNKDVKPDLTAVTGHALLNDDRNPLYIYAGELCLNTSSGLNLNHWVKSVQQISQLRKTQDIVNSINEVISSSGDIGEKLQEIETMFDADIGLSTTEVGAKHISDCMYNYLDDVHRRQEDPDSVIFTTGIPDLDVILGGGYEIGLHAIGANPKMGKTEMMGQMINHFGVDRQLPVYVGSMEMQDMQVIHRLVSSYGKIDKQSIYNGFKDEFDQELAHGHFAEVCHAVGSSNIYIDDRHANTTRKIRRECKKIEKKHGRLGGIFVDYLTLLEIDGKHDRHDLAIGAMTRALKGMSKEFSCPVVMLLQLNRGNTARVDKKPLASDSRDSGAIEQDVDTWTGIYRDSVYNENSPWKNITEFIVRLNRHGGTGTCYQALTSKGFINVPVDEVARLVHMEETSQQSGTGNF